jgi:mannose/fructose-specific phosphotransferase system component IIA
VSTRKVLGWGPQEVEPGNAVFVVQGFNLPMIVRKSQANNYRFMGPRCVHGYMGGEAFDVEGLADEEIVVA